MQHLSLSLSLSLFLSPKKNENEKKGGEKHVRTDYKEKRKQMSAKNIDKKMERNGQKEERKILD